jgi:hypothetical protein
MWKKFLAVTAASAVAVLPANSDAQTQKLIL